MSEDEPNPGCGCRVSGVPDGSGRGRSTVRPEELKRSLAARLSRIEGQTRGIRRMIEEDAYCDDVLAQISAARAALTRTGRRYLIDHVRAGDDEIVDEIVDTLSKFM